MLAWVIQSYNGSRWVDVGFNRTSKLAATELAEAIRASGSRTRVKKATLSCPIERMI